ncbi:Phosphoglycolate phosphatase, HAD superfamily [Tenacibaculum sp. MAR_2009_124]|uniref:HAD family hydrolase n=1 Tax=Tenacibaculum sp. MAR_2009_124 TaxID=1250059 RepID=UPI00089D6E35|nr:HAD hydrolase-like protein [Tenacibaculum sp. MAR_2009_124]SED08237.1 Phosphoglycolate phosphatase, HAD superfamily [Tenacibaculum sp. MAR_2009_124]
MTKKNLIVLDIDDTLTKSEEKHTDSLLFAMNHFGITDVNTDWRTYKNASDSYIFAVNYSKTHGKDFSFDLIPEFEKVMTDRFLTFPDTPEILDAHKIIDFFIQETDYGVCFATGSILKPALLKLQQAGINMIPEVLESSNEIFTREGIVTSAMNKAKKYYGVNEFDHIISFGDALWDVTTAQNLGIHFVGVNKKNIEDFTKMNIKHHINDWSEFSLEETEKKLGIK